jgi:hypothetical protein
MSALREVADSFVDELLKPQEVTPSQVGPFRLVDKERRCANRGCGSSTYGEVQGIPRCMTHAIQELNAMLVEAGFVGIVR